MRCVKLLLLIDMGNSATHLANTSGRDIFAVCSKNEGWVRDMTRRGINGDLGGFSCIGSGGYHKFEYGKSGGGVYFSIIVRDQGMVRDTNRIDDDRSILYDGGVHLTRHGNIWERERQI